MPRLATFWWRMVNWLFVLSSPAVSPATPEAFFGLTNLWTLHLSLPAEHWRQLEPARPSGWEGPDHDARPRPESARPPAIPPDLPRPGTGPGNRPPPGGPGQVSREFPWTTGTVEFAGQQFTHVGVRFKGNSSFNAARESPKKPFKLDFDRHVPGRRFMGLEELFLNNNVNELAHLREPLAYDVFRRAGVPSPRTAFVRVYLNVPGFFERSYLGLYTAVEPVEGDFLDRTVGSHQGLLVKPERIRGIEYFGDDWHDYTNRYEVKSDFKTADAERLVKLAWLVDRAPDAEFNAQLETLLDVESALRFIAVNAALANLDSFLGNGHNYYLFFPRNRRPATLIPWDLNEAFGGHPMAGDNRAQAEFSLLRPAAPENRLVARLLAQPAWAARYRQICSSMLTNALDAQRLTEDAGRIVAATQAALDEDPHRRRLRGGPKNQRGMERPDDRQRPESARPNPPQARNPGPTPPTSGSDFRPSAPLPLAEWIRLRDANLRAELAGERPGTSPNLRRFPGGPRPRPPGERE